MESTVAVAGCRDKRYAQEEERTECGNNCDISLVAYAGKVLLKIVAMRLRA